MAAHPAVQAIRAGLEREVLDGTTQPVAVARPILEAFGAAPGGRVR